MCMPKIADPSMTQRNLIWLAVILLAGVVGGFVLGLPIGLIPAAVVLVISEVVERTARRKRTNAAAVPIDA